jgi:NADPH-dependent ferric siderophore reductase
VPFDLTRHPFAPRFRQVRLSSRTELVPGFVRVRLQSEGPLDGLTSPGAGDHLRVFTAPHSWLDPVPVDETGEPLPPSRTETIVALDADAGWVDLDILIHPADASADAGIIGPWAATAPIGSPAIIADPKGSVVLSGRPAAFVMAADDSAIPAARRYLSLLGDKCPGVVLLETSFDPHALGLRVGAGVELRVLAPDSARPSAALADALTTLAASPPPAGADEAAPQLGPDVFVFACGEQSLVAPARALLSAWGIDAERAVVKGYWKRRTPAQIDQASAS